MLRLYSKIFLMHNMIVFTVIAGIFSLTGYAMFHNAFSEHDFFYAADAVEASVVGHLLEIVETPAIVALPPERASDDMLRASASVDHDVRHEESDVLDLRVFYDGYPPQVRLLWDDVDAVRYEIYRDGTFYLSTHRTVFFDGAVYGDTPYTYQVFAFDGDRISHASQVFAIENVRDGRGSH